MREFQPIPDPGGALQPPNRRPPTAVGVETPDPEPAPRPSVPARQAQSLLESVLEVVLAVPILLAGALGYPVSKYRRRGRRR
jgi:hypothetical protein